MDIKHTRYTAESALSDAENILGSIASDSAADLHHRINVARSDLNSLDIVDAPDSDYDAVEHEASLILQEARDLS